MIEREHKILLEKGPGRISPFFIPATIINLASGYVSIRTGAKGPNSATATACTTSAHAVGDSFRMIQHGDADVMICGGAEACITPLGDRRIRARCARSRSAMTIRRTPAVPGIMTRDGFVVGEGAGILVLEELEHAKRRGAPILAEIVGYGMSGDAYHITSPSEDGDGAYRVMRNCLRDAETRAASDRLHQRARHVDAAGRSHRNHRHQARVRRACLQGCGEFHQIDDRASAGRRRRTGSRHHGAGDSRSDRAADHQSTNVPIRNAISITCRITRGR